MFASFSTNALCQQRKAVSWEKAVLQHDGLTDNARPHVSTDTTTHMTSKSCVLLKQAPYSPDTNILDRFIFTKLKMERSEIVFRELADDISFLNNASLNWHSQLRASSLINRKNIVELLSTKLAIIYDTIFYNIDNVVIWWKLNWLWWKLFFLKRRK